MTTELTPLSDLPSLVPTVAESKALVDDSTPFLPSIKLIQPTTDGVNDPDPPYTAGEFFVKTNTINLSSQFRAIVAARRNHALLLENNKITKQSYDYESPLFQEIKNTKNNREEGILSMSGKGDWLFWLPDYNIFVTYFCGKSSNRGLTNDILDYITPPEQRATVLAKEKVETKFLEIYSHWETKKWGDAIKCFVPKCRPLEEEEVLCPDTDRIATDKALFYQPVLLKVEEAEEESSR